MSTYIRTLFGQPKQNLNNFPHVGISNSAKQLVKY